MPARKHPIESAEERRLPDDHDAVRRAVKVAVTTGDLDLLRGTLFEPTTWFDGSRDRWVMKPGIAMALLEGFDDEALGTPIRRDSFAELCFEVNQSEMLREVLECVHPAHVAGLSTADDARWLQHLCTRHLYGEHAMVSLVRIATNEIRPQSRDFIRLSLEFNPTDMAIPAIKFTNAEAGALLTECEMAMRVQQTMAQASSTGQAPATQTDEMPRARRRTL